MSAGPAPVDATPATLPDTSGPVTPAERIRSIDVLRGFALLGILAVNMQIFAMISAVLFNPPAYGDFTGANRTVWLLTYLFFDQKFMTIFSMLFGAGIVLMTERAEARGESPAGIHYRRMLWLMVFGSLHGHLLWFGDILFLYGLCGLVVFLFRKLSARWLIPLGIATIAVSSVLFIGIGFTVPFWSEADHASFEADFVPSAEAIQEELDTYRSGWLTQMTDRPAEYLGFQTFVALVWGVWRAGGLMLVGMGLFKLGVFSARLSRPAYGAMLAVGLIAGLPVVYHGAYRLEASGWAPAYVFFHGTQFNYWGSLLVSTGYVGMIMLLCRSSVVRWLQSALAAVGRTAFSNYILQTVICTTLFYGHGFGLFGHVSRVGQAAIVVAIWIVQLVVAPLWLRRFRFGPLEWLWRSLTYGRAQPFRRPTAGQT